MARGKQIIAEPRSTAFHDSSSAAGAENDHEQKALNFLTTNVNGLCSNTKQSELSVLLKARDIDAAVITETHLNEDIDNRSSGGATHFRLWGQDYQERDY